MTCEWMGKQLLGDTMNRGTMDFLVHTQVRTVHGSRTRRTWRKIRVEIRRCEEKLQIRRAFPKSITRTYIAVIPIFALFFLRKTCVVEFGSKKETPRIWWTGPAGLSCFNKSNMFYVVVKWMYFAMKIKKF